MIPQIPSGTLVRDRISGREMHVDGPLRNNGIWDGRYSCRWVDETSISDDGSIWPRRGPFRHEDLIVMDGPIEPELTYPTLEKLA